MRPIPEKLREQMNNDPAMYICVYNDEDCCDMYDRKAPRPEWEHCFTYAGRQINEWWAIIAACWYHHRGPGLNKEYNRYRALKRMTEEDLKQAELKYPKFNWRWERDRLMKKYD